MNKNQNSKDIEVRGADPLNMSDTKLQRNEGAVYDIRIAFGISVISLFYYTFTK